MMDQSDSKSEDIEEFLNESFMIIDELEDNHNSRPEKNPLRSKDNRDNGVGDPEVLNGGSVEANPNDDREDRPQQIKTEVVEEAEHRDGEVELTEDGEAEHKEEEEDEHDDDIDFLNDTEIEEIAYNFDSGDVSKQDETESVEEKSENVTDVQAEGTNEDADEAEEEDNAIDSHPYLYLIDTFEPTKEQKSVSNVGPPKPCTETPLHIVHTRTQLLHLLQTLRTAKEISLDLQVDMRMFHSSICLLEISTLDSDYIIDGLKLKSDLLLLTEIFINPKIVKIHKAEHVLRCLQQLLHLFVVNVFDIDKAGKALNNGQSVNLNMLLKTEYSLEVDWKLCNSDFRVRPLPEDLKAYCRTVPHYLIYLYHDYKNRLLKDEKLYKDVMDQCRNMCKVLYPDRKITQLSTLEEELKKRHACQLEILRKLYNWREKIAKKNNKNPDMITPKSTLLNIASNMPNVDTSLFGLCNSHYVRTDGEKLIAVISECKKKHQVVHKRVRKGKKEREAEASYKEIGTPQGAKRQLNENKVECPPNKQSNENKVESPPNKQSNENKVESPPNKQKKMETTFIKPKNEKTQTRKKSFEKPSFNHTKQKPTNSSSRNSEKKSHNKQKPTNSSSRNSEKKRTDPSSRNSEKKRTDPPKLANSKPSTFLPPRKPNLNKSALVGANLNKSALVGAKLNTNFKHSSFLNNSAPKPLLSLTFNNIPAANIPGSSTPKYKTKVRKSRFEPLPNSVTTSSVVLKPTNVPSNTHFQTVPTFSGTPFQGLTLNRFQAYTSPLSNFSGVGRANDGLNMYPQANLIANVRQDGRLNTFNQVFDVIDQKINTLERKVSEFEVTNDPNDIESNMYKRRYN